jgi:hypothetical protein
VVVCDNDVQASLLGMFHLGDIADAAVNGDHQGSALFPQVFQRVQVKPIAVLETVCEIRDDFPAEMGKALNESSGAADAIGIIIAVDGNDLTGEQGTIDPGYRLVHIGEEEGVTLKTIFYVEEGFGLLGLCDGTVIEELGHQRRYSHSRQTCGGRGRKDFPPAVIQLSAFTIFSEDKDGVMASEAEGI